MPRKNIIRTDQFPYHVVSRSNNKEWFYIPISDVWAHATNLLKESEKLYSVQTEAFVLMSNHYHLCVYTPNSNIDCFMQFFNKNLGQKISRQAGRINRIFGAPYKWSLITKDPYFQHVIRYIYQNPLRAGLCSKCEEYPFSDILDQKFDHEKLKWINRIIDEREEALTRKNLRKFLI
jgi:putative transposase